jgi:hypothetical protein
VGGLGHWRGLLTGQYNDILLTQALVIGEGSAQRKAWASLVVDVLTASIPAEKAFGGHLGANDHQLQPLVLPHPSHT